MGGIQRLLCVWGAVGGCRLAKGGIMYGCLGTDRMQFREEGKVMDRMCTSGAAGGKVRTENKEVV